LGIFATNNNCTALQVEKRWKFIVEKLKEEGIEVKCFATDGAPNFLSAMKLLLDFGVNIFQIKNMKFLFDINSSLLCIQDIIHLLNKLKMQLLDDSYELWMGKYLASGKHIRFLVESNEYSKNDHGLMSTDVLARDLTKDKMDFSSTNRLCDEKVIKILEKMPEAAGTVQYLKIMRMLIDAFLIDSTPVKERILKGFYVLIFLRKWRMDIYMKGKKSEKCFISKNCWDSIEICVPFLAHLAKNGIANLITFCSSQPCESFFRELRSMSTSGLTDINFTIFDCIRKVEKIQTLEVFSSELKYDGIKFPVKNVLQSNSDSSLDSLIEEDEIMSDDETWNDDMLAIIYNDAEKSINEIFSQFSMISQEFDFSKFFSAPNRNLLLRNEMDKYNKRNYNVEPIELEAIMCEDGNLIGEHIVFKNQKILNEKSSN
jgi:hypothetical protein